MLNVSPYAQWVVGILLAVIAYFLIRIVKQIDEIAKNVQQLMISDGVKKEQINNSEKDISEHGKRIHSIERQLKLTHQ